jgi:DNA polymerase-3 subunit delta
MIVKSGDAERFIEKPPRGLSAVLVFGPDQGLVRERAEKLVKSVVPDLNDAFRVTDLDDDVLLDDAARLFDEAAAIAMLGGRRVVRVRGAGNSLAKLFESFLDDHAGDALVVVESGDLAKGTGLRRVFEEDDKAYAVPCYADSPSDLFDVVRAALKAEALSIDPDALEDAVTRREIEKLVLYARGEKRVTLADVRAAMGDEVEARVEEACDAAAMGDLPRLDLALERLWLADTSPVAVVRMALGHFQRLALLKSYAGRGESADAAIRRLRPPVHFMRIASLKAELQKWSEGRIGEALELLFDTEALCKTTAVPAEAACARALFNVAAMARGRLS